ncbi:MAG: TldD/PmbA family protein [Acidobacteriota bacterium]
MKREMLDLCASAVATAKKSGAQDCKATFSRSRIVQVRYRDRRPEVIREASTQRLDVDIYVDRRYSSQSTSDLRPKPLDDFIANAVMGTKLLAEDPFRTLPDRKYYQGRATVDLKLADAEHSRLSPERRHEIVRTVEAACLQEGGPKAISVTANMQDRATETAVMTSNGLEGFTERTTYSIYATISLQDEGDRRPAGGEYVAACALAGLGSPEEVGREAARRGLALLGGKKIKTETLPIIVENRGVSRVGGGLLEALFASAIQQKQSFLAEKKGQKIASQLLALIDDPLLVGGLESRLFDDDGFATRKRTIVDAGVLKDYYVDWYYGRKLGWEPTGGTATNLIVPPGRRSPEQIMKDLGRGILITDFIGGNSNPTTGDFSIGIIGQLFENGARVHPVVEMNIAGNHLSFWDRLIEVGNDPWMYDSSRTPSLVFKDVVVSGA